MTRKQQLLDCFKDCPEEKKALIETYIDRIIPLEEQLLFWEKQPKYKVHPKNKNIVKPTDASKEYLKYMQQYNVALKNLLLQLGKTEVKEDSPLRLYLKSLESI